MRIKTYNKGGYIDGGFTSGGGTMTGPLILAADPTKDLEVATKQYADSKLLSFDASKFTAGTLQVGRLPAFTGDVTSTTGSSNISLATLGVSPGVYTKVTVNAKGLVTAGFSLAENDLPDLDWGKITTGKPTTLSGYGITDGLPKTGGMITGTLTLSGDPTVSNQAATKQYVDSNASSFSALKTGDILTKMNSVTPTGFLRCNGGLVSKTTYAALYAAVGDNFLSGTQAGNGQPWRHQYDLNTSQSGDITGWTTQPVFPTTLYDHQVIVTKNRVYALGGTGSTAPGTTVYTAPVNADGTLGAWSAGTSLPTYIAQAQAIVTKNHVYLLGGDSSGGVATSAIYTAPINADGTLGTWTAAVSLPGPLTASHVIMTKNRVYLCGGNTGNSGSSATLVATVYTAPINSDGTLGIWTTGTPLPTARSMGKAFVTKNRAFIASGFAASGYTPTVITAPINTDGTLGTWTSSIDMPSDMSISQCVVTKSSVYLLGGIISASGNSNRVYKATIALDGTISSWVLSTPIPQAQNRSQVIVTSTRIYLIAGYISGQTDFVCSAPFSGGLNDYTSYYDGSVTAVNGFNLPDLSGSDLTGSYSYIKI